MLATSIGKKHTNKMLDIFPFIATLLEGTPMLSKVFAAASTFAVWITCGILDDYRWRGVLAAIEDAAEEAAVAWRSGRVDWCVTPLHTWYFLVDRAMDRAALQRIIRLYPKEAQDWRNASFPAKAEKADAMARKLQKVANTKIKDAE